MKYYLLILLAILPSSVFARQTPDSTRVFTEEHPLVYEDAWDLWPYSFLNENGDAVGYNIDLLRMLCKELDIPYVVKLKPTQDALNDLKDGHADLMCGMDANFHNEYGQYGKPGDYAIIPSGPRSDKYEIEFVEGKLTVLPKKLTVTALNDTIVYGDEPSNAGVEYSGFVVIDNEKSLNGSLVYSYDYKQYGNVGEYSVTPSGLTADNYEIEFVAGKLSVEPKEISVAWGESSFTYNGTEHVTAATAEGLVNSDKCGLTVAGAATNAGKYTATVTGLNNKNYKLPATGLEQAFEITKANPTIVKSPVAVENLVYNGKAQTLVTAGEAKNGTLVYKLASEEKYSEALPTATNGGDYTVYFMVLGNANYNDLEAQTLTASIKVPVSSSSSSIPASSSSAIASSSSVAESSSSSVIASSSSSAPASSSSAVKPSSSSVIASSSSSAPASSSSAVKPSSSSSDSTTPVNMTTLASAFRVVYARNELVVTNSVASELKVSVFDVQGNLKMQYRGSTAGNHSISLKQCVPGIYLVRVESSGKVQMLQVHVK